MPDGEVGPRQHWISRVHYQVLAGHPELEIVRRPRPENGVERLNPRDAADSWQFKVRGGVDRVRFGDPGWRLGYAREAVNSYFVFKTLREKGVLARHLRFQVSLPSVNSALPPRIFPDPGDVAKVRPGFAGGAGGRDRHHRGEDPGRGSRHPMGLRDRSAGLPMAPFRAFRPKARIARNLEQFRALSPRMPEQAQLGYHFCFGTLGGWPRFAPDDLSATVEACQCGGRGVGPPRRLDPHPGARPRR